MSTRGTEVVAERTPPHRALEDGPDEMQAVLRATSVTKAFYRGWWPRRRALRVLQGADLELRRGEIVGLVGENGSGKSTLAGVSMMAAFVFRRVAEPQRA